MQSGIGRGLLCEYVGIALHQFATFNITKSTTPAWSFERWSNQMQGHTCVQIVQVRLVQACTYEDTQLRDGALVHGRVTNSSACFVLWGYSGSSLVLSNLMSTDAEEESSPVYMHAHVYVSLGSHIFVSVRPCELGGKRRPGRA